MVSNKRELDPSNKGRKNGAQLKETLKVKVLLLCSMVAINSGPVYSFKYFPRPPSYGRAFQRPLVKDFRGGSAESPGGEEEEEDEETRKKRELLQSYRLTQHLYLQSRSFALRQTLVQRGLTELEQSDVSSLNIAKESDWDCALSSHMHPKSCLFSLDAEVGSKVLAPVDTSEWITVAALNRLRRNDPAKVDPLWHSKYKVLLSWFGSDSQYALNAHAPASGVLFVTGMLDRPRLLKLLVSVAFGLAFVVALPLLEALVQFALVQPYLWSSWARWGPRLRYFLQAGLPLKLFMLQFMCIFMSKQFGGVFEKIRERLVEAECDMLQNCVPLTILEDDDEY